MFIFFFQAEDGIRDKLVTGVQTCALPICGSVEEEVASLHAAKTKGNRPMRIVTKGTLRSCSMGSPLQRCRGPRPRQRAEPGAAHDGGEIDEASGDKPEALREKHVPELTGPAQREPAGERRDRKARHGAEERTQQPDCAMHSDAK